MAATLFTDPSHPIFTYYFLRERGCNLFQGKLRMSTSFKGRGAYIYTSGVITEDFAHKSCREKWKHKNTKMERGN
jgi:hypothetical protein